MLHPAGKRIGPRYEIVLSRVKAALRRVGDLSDKEIDFLTTLEDRLETYEGAAYVSTKQLNWLTRIEADLS